MTIKNIAEAQLLRALDQVNERYNNNLRIEYSSINAKNTRFKFRLFVKSSREAGARRSWSGRRLINACWHVHGDFFDTVLAIAPEAVIRASTQARPIYSEDGQVFNNWIDVQVGSMMQPSYMSDNCDCNRGDI